MRHLTGRYHAEEVSTVRRFLLPGDVCLDVGAHAGLWTRPLAQLVPQGHVYAFEALPHYARTLRLTVRLLGLSNVTVLNNAVADFDRDVDVAWRTRQGRRLTGNTHIATSTERKEVDCVRVSAITLDKWLTSLPGRCRIGFVKIDVEGAELMAMRGARELLKTHRPPIFLEIVTACCERYGYRPVELFHFFAEAGYEAYTITSNDPEKRLKRITPEAYCGKGDVLFLPAGQERPPSDGRQ